MVTSSVSPGTDPRFFFFSFVWVSSFIAGFVFVIVPGGIGIRESAMTALMVSFGFPIHVSLIIPLITRFQSMIIDGFTGLIHIRKKRPGSDFLVMKETLGHQRFKLIRKSIIKTGSRSLLDVGCGTGHNLLLNGDLITRGVGIDTSGKRLGIAREHARSKGNENVTFRKMSGFDLDYRNGFDMVLLTEILEHVREDGLLLEKSIRSLKKGGHVLITVPSKRGFLFTRRLRDRLEDRDHVRPGYTINELTDLVGGQGIRTVSIGYHGQFLSSIIHYMASMAGMKGGVKIESGSGSWLYRLYSILWPLIVMVAYIDNIIPRSVEGGFVFLLGEKL
jgi:SAM-dependent methyltransferase